MLDKVNSLSTRSLLQITVVLLALIYFVYVISAGRASQVERFESPNPDLFDPSTYTSVGKPDYELYKRIIDTFNEVLDRQPTPSELFENFNRVKSGEGGFSLKKMRDMLLGSGEFSRKDGIQNNSSSQDVAKAVNDAQIKDTVTQAYISAIGKPPTIATVEYLKEQYVKSGLDDAKLKLIIEGLSGKSLKSAPPVAAPQPPVVQTPPPLPPAVHTPAPVHNPTPVSAATPAPVPVAAPASAPVAKKEKTPASKRDAAVVLERPNIFNFYGVSDPSKSVTCPAQKKAATCNKKTPHSKFPVPNYDPNDPNNFDNAMCGCLNKDAMGLNLDRRDQNMLAELQNDRNMEEVELGCGRASTDPMSQCAAAPSSVYTNADDNGKLFPQFSWAVPDKRLPQPPSTMYSQVDQTALLGTLLKDSEKTSVGSIMSPFTYCDK